MSTQLLNRQPQRFSADLENVLGETAIATGEAPSVYLRLATPKNLSIGQNRKFFRLPLFIKAVVVVKVAKNQLLSGKSDANALTDDTSAGGVRLDPTLALEAGDTVSITLRLPLRRGEDGDVVKTATSPAPVLSDALLQTWTRRRSP